MTVLNRLHGLNRLKRIIDRIDSDACIARPIILPPNLSASGTLRNTVRLSQKMLLDKRKLPA